jgi:acyl-CoA thioesterase
MDDELRGFFARDRLGQFLGMEVSRGAGGAIEGRLRVDERHLNGVGTAHGGAVFTLADVVFAATVNSGGQVAVAVNTTLSFFRATAPGETLVARAREVARSRRLVHVAVEVANERGEPVALFHGTAYVKVEAPGA